MSLGDTIRAKRESLGLSRVMLAAHIGVTKQALSNWELGTRRPGYGNMLRLSELLDIPAATLLRLAAQ